MEFPLPMQYLGSKKRISHWVIDAVETDFPNASFLVDVMAGSGAVSHTAVQRGFNIYANDLQPYSTAVLTSVFETSREGIPELIDFLESERFETLIGSGERAVINHAAEVEQSLCQLVNTEPEKWSQLREFIRIERKLPQPQPGSYNLFTSIYSNNYFGYRQCQEIDALRELADSLPNNLKKHVVAAVVSAMTYVASTTTHLAQYLKPTTVPATINLGVKRSASVVQRVVSSLRALKNYPIIEGNAVGNGSFENALRSVRSPRENTVVYADPPYFKEHYSRYYHVLDTFVLYDYPRLSVNSRTGQITSGLYREKRLVSDFGLKAKAPSAFQNLISSSLDVSDGLILSYAATSIVSRAKIEDIASEAGVTLSVRSARLKHSGQGAKTRQREVEEYLFTFTKE